MEIKVSKGSFKFIGTKTELKQYLSDLDCEVRKKAKEVFENGMQVL